jgi:lipoprotein-releasing system permease protein
MFNATNFKVALSHMVSRMRQTIVAILSVTFGISMYVVMTSFMTGINVTQTELAFSTLAHIRIYNELPKDRTNLLSRQTGDDALVHLRHAKVIQYTDGIRNSSEIMDILEDYPEVIASTPQVNLTAYFRSGTARKSASVTGVDAVRDDRIFSTSAYMVKGEWETLRYRKDGVILGSGLARKLGVKPGDHLSLLTVGGITKNMEVVGIVEFTLSRIDNVKAYIHIDIARQMLSENQDFVTDIQLNIKDYKQATRIAQKLRNVTDYTVETWEESNGQLKLANDLRDVIGIAVSLAIMVVAGFGIYNIMNMTINEKIREIAILRAMGFNGKDVIAIFLSQSIVIGILGGITGMLLGYAITRMINQIPFHVGTLTTYPVTYRTIDYMLSFLFGFLATFVAGFLPARKAARLDPVAILRR